MSRLNTAQRVCRVLAILSVILVLLIKSGEHNAVALRITAGVALAAIIADAVLTWRLRKRAEAAQARAPKQSVTATVVSRRTTYRWIMHGGRAAPPSGRDAWYVSFRTARGHVVEFETPYDVYERLREGVRGRLRYQGSRFIAFQEEPRAETQKGEAQA